MKETSRLTRDGMAEPVSRDHILRRKRGQGKKIPIQLTTSRIGIPRPVDLYSCYMRDHTYCYFERVEHVALRVLSQSNCRRLQDCFEVRATVPVQEYINRLIPLIVLLVSCLAEVLGCPQRCLPYYYII